MVSFPQKKGTGEKKKKQACLQSECVEFHIEAHLGLQPHVVFFKGVYFFLPKAKRYVLCTALTLFNRDITQSVHQSFYL